MITVVIIKLAAVALIAFDVLVLRHAGVVVVVAQDIDITPNYAYCDEGPTDYYQACRMAVTHWSASRKAERDGLVQWFDLPPPSAALGLPTHRLPTTLELLKQMPLSVISQWYDCTSILGCLCKKFGGTSILDILLGNLVCRLSSSHNFIPHPLGDGVARARRQAGNAHNTLGRCTRMEYRMLSDDQRTRFHDALLQLKRGYGSYEYDRLSALHANPDMMPAAHSGPTFPLWHREYNKRLEIALRAIDPSVCLPFWDPTMDQRLPNPADSIMFSEQFMGSTDRSSSFVNTGFLSNWITSNGNPVSRTMGADGGRLISETEVNNVISIQEINHIFAFTGGRRSPNCTTSQQPRATVLEFVHNNVHVWVGGDMEQLFSSPQDPIFFIYHCFIDYLWEQWRLRHQDRAQRETQFPPDDQIVACSGSSNYRLDATMYPFTNPTVLNRAGLSNNYTDFLYTYALRPTCQQAGGCRSSYLFCDTTRQRTPSPICCAKIRPGGDCSFFVGNAEESCYNSTCVNGRCEPRQQQQQQQFVGGVLPVDGDRRGPAQPATPTQRECYDNDVCCVHWASNGTCRTAPRYMNTWCPGSCRFDGCRPYATSGDTTAACNDIHTQCRRWSLFSDNGHKECDQNPRWMACNCAAACHKCGSTTPEQCAARTPTDYIMPSYGGGGTTTTESIDATIIPTAPTMEYYTNTS